MESSFLDGVPLVEYVVAPYPAGLYQIRPRNSNGLIQVIGVDRYLEGHELDRLNREGWRLIRGKPLVKADDVLQSQYANRSFYAYILEKL